MAMRWPKPYSALSSKSELDQAGPRPSQLMAYGMVGRLPPKMEEQPVALATTRRSPNICVNNLRYGVSPQPAQAPENSSSGSRNCVPLTSSGNLSRSGDGRLRKNWKFSRSWVRRGSIGTMLRALAPASSLDLTGQTATQRLQPVQSSGATCRLYCESFHSCERKAT